MDARYKKIVLNGKFVSIMRDPVRRYLSHYHYYNQPLNHSFDEYLTWTDYNNYMTKDFGIHNQSELHRFLVSNYHQFFFLITEKLDESLVLLKNTWSWSLQDILYLVYFYMFILNIEKKKKKKSIAQYRIGQTTVQY
eukprot:Phypoly_transcript_25426.p1 GENE.Phypoly_transcript_25426~~Phypoly_transcript_25426.p1  ORF type:complete len:137 (-),score=16.05 Phypoly_transcript_25426:19-429(-)